MVNDVTYKVSLALALILHVVLVIFLFIKFTHSGSNIVSASSNNIIKAVAINDRDIDNQVSKMMVKQPLPEKVEKAPEPKVKPQAAQPVTVEKSVAKKEQLQTILKKNLLSEQARELAELKKEKQKYKKTVAKHQEQQMQKIIQDQISAEQKQLAGSQDQVHGSTSSGEVNKQLALIKQVIDSQWIKPEGLALEDFCTVEINIAPGGEVLKVQVLRSSGNLALDRSAQAAVLKSSPLPVPEDTKLFDDFRVLKPTFRAEGIVGN